MSTVRLVPAAWRARAAAHEARVDGWLGAHIERRRHHRRHPVEDFLFGYYSHRPARLRRWHPGAGVILADADPAWFGSSYVPAEGGATVDAAALLSRRRGMVARIRALLVATATRPAHLGCFGLHEWAMVYRQPSDQLRHGAWPLRLGPGGTERVVTENRIRCSHFDAYRFFSPSARPLNQLRPTRENQPELEQPGCLHANMDLYKWAYKLSPLVASELVADCFALARQIRVLDMRASPYDLTALGYPPLRVETPEGRAEYTATQRTFAERAGPLRGRLVEAIDAVLDPARTDATPGPCRRAGTDRA